MGIITAEAKTTKIVGTENTHSVDITFTKADSSDRLIWRFVRVKDVNGVTIPATSTNSTPGMLLTSTSFTPPIDALSPTIDVNMCRIVPDTDPVFNMNIYYISEDNKKGSCTKWEDFPEKYQTIYRYQPPSSNTANMAYKVDIEYYAWQGADPTYATITWLTMTLDVSLTATYNFLTSNNKFQHYLHAGIMAQTALSTVPYDVLPGSSDGSVFVDPLSPAANNPDQVLLSSNYFPSDAVDGGGFSWTTLTEPNAFLSPTYTSITSRTQAFSFPFTVTTGGPKRNFMFDARIGTGYMTMVASKYPNSILNVKGENCLTNADRKFSTANMSYSTMNINWNYFSQYARDASIYDDYMPPGQYYMNIFPSNGLWPTTLGDFRLSGDTPDHSGVVGDTSIRPYPAIQASASILTAEMLFPATARVADSAGVHWVQSDITEHDTIAGAWIACPNAGMMGVNTGWSIKFNMTPATSAYYYTVSGIGGNPGKWFVIVSLLPNSTIAVDGTNYAHTQTGRYMWGGGSTLDVYGITPNIGLQLTDGAMERLNYLPPGTYYFNIFNLSNSGMQGAYSNIQFIGTGYPKSDRYPLLA